MEEEMMQGGGAPMGGPAAPDMGPEDQKMQEAVMMIVDELMKVWKETGMVGDQKIENEQEAKKYAMALAMEELEKQAAGAQGPPQGAPPQGGPAGGAPPMGGAPGGGGAPMM